MNGQGVYFDAGAGKFTKGVEEVPPKYAKSKTNAKKIDALSERMRMLEDAMDRLVDRPSGSVREGILMEKLRNANARANEAQKEVDRLRTLIRET